MVVFFVTDFLIASGDSFHRKMVRIAAPTFTQKKITLQVLGEITEHIHRHLAEQILTSVLVGVSTWLVLAWTGLERAAVWGIAAAVLNFVPYIGSIVVSGGLALGASCNSARSARLR